MSPGADDLCRQLDALLNGTSFYAQRERLREDDRILRERISANLVEAARLVRDLSTAYRRKALPPPTREHPDPDPEALSLARSLDTLLHEIQDVDGLVRAAPFPHSDRTWQRLRSGELLLSLLLENDVTLVQAAGEVRDQARVLAAANLSATALVHLNEALSVTRDAFQRRQDDLNG